MSNRSIDYLKKNSNKGSLFSLFQLLENEGLIDSEKVNLSSELLKNCLSYVTSIKEEEAPFNKIHLEKIQLHDFRKFRSIEVNFDNDLTVFIGSNGAGKSTIIEAITKTISWIGNGLIKEGDNGRPITYDDINNNSSSYAEINSYFKYGKTEFSGNISKAVRGRTAKKDSHVYDLKQFANILRALNNIQQINLPLFCYYPVERLKDSPKNALLKDSLIIDRYYAYKDAWDGKLKLDDFFTLICIIYNKSKLNNDLEEINSLKNKLDQLKSINFSDLEIINLLQKQLHELESKNNFDSSHSESELDFKKFVETIKESLINDLLGIKDISFNNFSGRTQIYFHLSDGNIVSSKQLSHGQKVTYSLIGDICLRLLLLNPNLKNPLKGQGIILIDELELHLHPKWQQRILVSLRNTFPNIQFIVSTHSPQILSTIDKKHIRILEENDSIIEPNYQTEGTRSSDILEQLMSTHSSPDIKINYLYNKYLALVEQNIHETQEAQELGAELASHYGEKHPKIQEIKSLIRLKELKNKIASKKMD
ncbi:retron Ec78 anti-phage system effector ATPase PtuA [Empedobacter sp.]|uniref:retron Ec78 anti-phage system effector ATPase PtuA n=1 Tax=Empedobacter sp. TaxID=1927715 RepID=UPI0028B0D9DA|nr:retron Ec78 anti-phage system effector ATPase PtuA [Empedobacter sp.]